MIEAYTDYPILALGDRANQLAPVRKVNVLSYDGVKRCCIEVHGVRLTVKRGYLYTTLSRVDDTPAPTVVDVSTLPVIPYPLEDEEGDLMKAIGDRMKQNYELPAVNYLTRRVPVIIRVDGKAFHTLTRHMERPFDDKFIKSMLAAAQSVGAEMQGFKAGYVQSDEASFLLTDYDTTQTDAWFGYNKSKLESISAAFMSVAFSDEIRSQQLHCESFICFDSRSFNVPREEVCNYFLWRMMDWERNSLAMCAQSRFSHGELHGKDKAAQHEMLHKSGFNWAVDTTAQQRNGTWFFPGGLSDTSVLPTYAAISRVLDELIYCDGES
jgi:tRNA(His) 5'-end guanylyltransferase